MRFAEAFDICHTPEPVTVRNVGGLHTEAVIVQLAVEIHLTAVKPYSLIPCKETHGIVRTFQNIHCGNFQGSVLRNHGSGIPRKYELRTEKPFQKIIYAEQSGTLTVITPGGVISPRRVTCVVTSRNYNPAACRSDNEAVARQF